MICALSGGVDSAVAALLIHRAVGEQLTCVFVDTGMLRQGEAAQGGPIASDKRHKVHLLFTWAAELVRHTLENGAPDNVTGIVADVVEA